MGIMVSCLVPPLFTRHSMKLSSQAMQPGDTQRKDWISEQRGANPVMMTQLGRRVPDGWVSSTTTSTHSFPTTASLPTFATGSPQTTWNPCAESGCGSWRGMARLPTSTASRSRASDCHWKEQLRSTHLQITARSFNTGTIRSSTLLRHC